MPINKDARIRYEILDECLRDTTKKWTSAELLRFVNRRLDLQHGRTPISARQLLYDLGAMETDLGAPVEMKKYGRSYHYRYSNPEFSIRDLPINEEDLQKLASAVQVLRQIQGFSIAEEIEEVVHRLERRSKYQEPGTDGPVIHFQDSPPPMGVENLEDIYQAILAKTPLKITYQSFHDEETRVFHMHPYLLKEYLHRWYLLGWCEEKKAIITLALDRMHQIRVARLEFIPNTFLNAKTYFRNVIGVTCYPGQPLENIELLFSPLMAPYVQTKALHHTQEVIRQYDDGSIYLSLKLHVNPELIVLLQGYGDGVKVLGPASLAATMCQTAAATFQQYKEGL
jgi:predicted DNA-binding transcriptional regulator YafY